MVAALICLSGCVRVVDSAYLAEQNAINTRIFYMGSDHEFHFVKVDYGTKERTCKVAKDQVEVAPEREFHHDGKKSIRVSGVSLDGTVVFRD